jgi:delta 1-pyrroline-5-carboxylate dehydrogenase
MAKTSNNDDFKKLGEKLREIINQAAQNITPLPVTTPVSISQLVAEGDAILKKEAEESVKKMSSEADISSKNPYVRARIAILKRMPEWKRSEIATMEKEGKLDNRVYEEFVKLIATEGDKLSS